MASDGRSYTSGFFALKLDNVNCGIVQKVEGGDVEGAVINIPVAHDDYTKKQVGGPRFKPINLQMGLGMGKPVRDWIIASLEMNYLRKSGEVQFADFKRDIRTVREFTDALVSEVTFPACDAGSKEPAYMGLKFTP